VLRIAARPLIAQFMSAQGPLAREGTSERWRSGVGP
jgi:hypothetical protein